MLALCLALPAGGLVVRLGCADTQALVALRKNENVIVHGLDVDPRIVEAARKQVDATSNYGPVSVGHFDGKQLPYADNLVNVLIADVAGDVADSEILRVLVGRLVPGSRAGVRSGGASCARYLPCPCPSPSG